MKVYLKNFESTLAFNILSYQQIHDNQFFVEINFQEKNFNLFFKRGSTKDFYSTDGEKWTVINKISHLSKIAIAEQLFNIHFGFIPNQQVDDQVGALMAKMPGKVVKVLTEQGCLVKKGQALIIIEAMKMENELKATFDGIVDKIHVVSGQNINAGETLISLRNP